VGAPETDACTVGGLVDGTSYTFTVTATNGVGSSIPSLMSDAVVPGAAPAITSTNAATFVVGSAGSTTVTTTGSPTPAVTETGALPGGVTFTDNGNGTATLAGTPAAGTAGSHPVTVTAANGIVPDASQALTLTVDQAPAITSASRATLTRGAAGTFTPTATGYPTPTITESGVLPAGVTFTGGRLTGTPKAKGNFPIAFTAHSGVGADAVQGFLLVVQGLHVTTTTLAKATRGVHYSATLSASGGTIPYVWKTSAVLPSGLKLSSAGVLSGTVPTTVAVGSRTITVTVTDAASPTHQKASATLTLRVA
jgi:hypothetical protein